MSMMVQKLRPLGDRVLVKRIESEERTAGGIYIPDAAKEKAQQGEVIAVGPKGTYVKVGDQVFFGKYAGTEAERDYLIIKEEELLGVIEK